MRGGVLERDIWAQGKRKECRSLVRPRSWPRGRGCNVPELPVESALDQVHSQAGASEAPASGVEVQGGSGPAVSHRAWTLISASPALWGLWPPRSQGTFAPSSLHSSPQKLPSPGQPKSHTASSMSPHPATAAPPGGVGGDKNGVVGHQKLSQALHMRGLWKCGKWVRCGKWGGIFPQEVI